MAPFTHSPTHSHLWMYACIPIIWEMEYFPYKIERFWLPSTTMTATIFANLSIWWYKAEGDVHFCAITTDAYERTKKRIDNTIHNIGIYTWRQNSIRTNKKTVACAVHSSATQSLQSTLNRHQSTTSMGRPAISIDRRCVHLTGHCTIQIKRRVSSGNWQIKHCVMVEQYLVYWANSATEKENHVMSCGQTNQSSYRILNCDQRHSKPLLEGEATRPIILVKWGGRGGGGGNGKTQTCNYTFFLSIYLFLFIYILLPILIAPIEPILCICVACFFFHFFECIRCVSAEMDKGNDSVDYPNSVCQNGK